MIYLFIYLVVLLVLLGITTKRWYNEGFCMESFVCGVVCLFWPILFAGAIIVGAGLGLILLYIFFQESA